MGDKMSDLFTRYLTGDNISFKHAKGISDRSGKEFHLFHEIILFLGGDAELISETVHIKLKPQTIIVIPKETYHQVLIKGKQDEYCRCVFQFYETEGNKTLVKRTMQGLFVTECDKNILYLFSKMIELAKKQDTTYCDTVSGAVLNLLVDEIRQKKSMHIEKDLSNALTRQAIELINNNLTDNLNVESLAQRLNVSSSTLMHTFKKTMNISIHKYIIEKRLILAHSKFRAANIPL